MPTHAHQPLRECRYVSEHLSTRADAIDTQPSCERGMGLHVARHLIGQLHGRGLVCHSVCHAPTVVATVARDLTHARAGIHSRAHAARHRHRR